jgi:CHASE2 domain-containing sensor protein/two-component sensor histidine kinase
MSDLEPADEGAARRRLTREWLAVATLATALSLALLFSGWTTRLDNVIYDAALRIAPRTPADDVLIVAIDDRALDEVGGWPWPRSRHAEIVRRLSDAGARAIAYDVLFIEPSAYAAEDESLAAAIGGSRRTCLPLLVEAPGPNGAAARIVPPAPPIARAAAGLGHVGLIFDPDGVSRRADLELRAGPVALPHLVQCARAVGSDAAPPPVPLEPRSVQGAVRRARQVLIPFAGAPGSFRTISAGDLLRGETPEAFVRGRYVLVGATAAGLHDTHSTPLSTRTETLAGVELQANLLEGLLHNRLIRPAPLWLAVLAALAPVWLHLLALRRASPRTNLAVAVATVAAVLLVSVGALALARTWIPPFPAALTLLLVFPAWGWRRLQAASDYLLEELARFAPEEKASVGRSGDVVGGRIAMLRRAVRRARRLQAQREEAVQLLSHDIRSPQASILALLESPDGRQAPPELTERLRRHASRTLALADNFTHLAKAESGALTLEPLDLSDLLDVALDELWPLARQAGVRLVRCGSDAEAWIRGDRSLLARALANLIENAIKFSPAGAVVEGRVELGPGLATLSIRDHGPGLSEEAKATMFERFARGGGREKGVGLGLLLVAEVTRSHGGAVDWESDPGRGAEFRITLPLDPASAP